MTTVTLGMTGLEVYPIAFGTWQLGGEWGEFDEQQAVAAIRQARELGVNLFDTAQGYGFGASEQLLGRALRDDLDNHRDEVVIATKGGLRMTDEGVLVYGPLAHGLLTGAMNEHTTFAADDWRSQSSVFEGEAFRRNLEMVTELERVAADELGASVAQLAVAWTLANPAVHVAIVGARSPRHIEEGVAAAQLRLSDVDLEEIDRIMAGSVAVAGPFPEMGRLSTETSVFTDANVS
jgi:aryl-alcohol dehydrogenase-like predicted oxidoreductase